MTSSPVVKLTMAILRLCESHHLAQNGQIVLLSTPSESAGDMYKHSLSSIQMSLKSYCTETKDAHTVHHCQY